VVHTCCCSRWTLGLAPCDYLLTWLCACLCTAGTLMVFAVVALALIWKRIVKQNAPLRENAKPLALICLLTCVCIGTPSGCGG
jgi:formate-dependent nitrite reductase membrane component NrfD